MSQERAQRFNELIKEELGRILFNFLDAKPGTLITITRVITSANLFSSNVYISIYPLDDPEKILKELNNSIYKIQQLLNKKMRVRPVPKIIFKRDKNPEEAGEIEKILKEIKNEK